MALTKDQIFNASDHQIKTLNIPEWGGDICLKTMTGFQRDKYESEILKCQKNNSFVNMRVKLAIYTVCDEDGNLLFEEKDINLLTKKSASALDKIFDEATKMNGISEEDIEELEKN